MGIGASAVAGVAGCNETRAGTGNGGEPTVTASFFVIGDFASEVAGDRATVETLVPVGQHGHGWEPDPDVTRRAVEADAFVYVADGFQPWADDVARNIREGDGEGVVIEAREGVDLLPAGGDHDEHEGDGDHHDEHDGPVDPHFWLDPTRAATAVESIRDGLRELDEGGADVYADDAAAYHDSLLSLDAEFEDALADRSRDTVLVAGHDAFQYLGDRYDIEIEALTGISPDDSATTDDVRRAQEVIETHGVRHVLAPVLESDRAARSLVADTDAEGVLPITALPGRHEEWDERGWGYEAVMREVNLPSLRTALGAE